MLYRHGDVLIQSVRSMPSGVKKQKHVILAEGEITGHSHRVKEPGVATMFRSQTRLYLRVEADCATVVHEEHDPIEIPQGIYEIWRQREYTPERIITVRD